MAPLHGVPRFVDQLSLQYAQVMGRFGGSDKNNLIRLPERALRPGRSADACFVHKVVELALEFFLSGDFIAILVATSMGEGVVLGQR